jgi:hypothetical protein
MEVVDALVSWAVTLPAAAAIIVRDERRLKGERLSRAWPPVSRDAALFLWYFGFPLCVVVHFWKTRRSLRGTLLGFAWMAAILVLDEGAERGIGAVIGGLGL